MWKAFVIVGLLVLPGCAGFTATEALILDAENVEEAIKLREAKDPKYCGKYMVTGDLGGVISGASVNGSMTGYLAIGKNLTYKDCVESLVGKL